MRRCISYLVIATALLLSASFAQNASELFERKGGLVRDKETAIRIAEAILFPIYGEKSIRAQQPYRVRLENGKWTIDGAPPPRGFAGGSFHVVILQRDARVLEIGHDV
ncbi:MAG TPA: NTF2 fold immunity protein [Candidatus Udaeobacter sp.]